MEITFKKSPLLYIYIYASSMLWHNISNFVFFSLPILAWIKASQYIQKKKMGTLFLV